MILSNLLKLYKTIKDYLTTKIWCGWCGETHSFGLVDSVVCSTTGQTLQGPKAWRVYTSDGTILHSDEKQDIFIAWDNLAKWRGEFKQKCVTEHRVWTMMFNNAYSKHKNPEGKYKGCKECLKTDEHRQYYYDLYCKASWRDSLDEGYGIDTLPELQKARQIEDNLERITTLLRCSSGEIDLKINKILKHIKELEAELTKINTPKGG